MILDINTDAISDHVKRLGTLHRSAFPIVVRQTLTAAAFDVKTKTMPEESHIFIHRKETFFIANSKAEPAVGFNISAMVATVGFLSKVDDKSHSVEDLEEQEYGGSIGNRAFVALQTARVGGSWQGLIQNKNRRNGAGLAIDSKDYSGKSPEQAFVKAAYEAGLQGKLLIGNRTNAKGDKIAWKVKPIGLQGQKGGPRMVMTFQKKYVENQVFAVKKGREVKPHATHFMEKASVISAGKMGANFMVLAEKRLARIS